TFPVYNYGFTGTAIASILYSGDAANSSGGTTRTFTITAPASGAGIIVSAPSIARGDPENAQGLSYTSTFSLRDVGNTASVITAFSIDGQAQPLSQYFPSPSIPPNGSRSTTVTFYNVPPSSKKFSVSGVDLKGNTWTREFSIQYLPPVSVNDFLLS